MIKKLFNNCASTQAFLLVLVFTNGCCLRKISIDSLGIPKKADYLTVNTALQNQDLFNAFEIAMKAKGFDLIKVRKNKYKTTGKPIAMHPINFMRFRVSFDGSSVVIRPEISSDGSRWNHVLNCQGPGSASFAEIITIISKIPTISIKFHRRKFLFCDPKACL